MRLWIYALILITMRSLSLSLVVTESTGGVVATAQSFLNRRQSGKSEKHVIDTCVNRKCDMKKNDAKIKSSKSTCTQFPCGIEVFSM